MKILHITNWYPSKRNPKDALWIKAHIDSLKPFVSDYFILHLQIQPSGRYKFYKHDLPKGLQRILEVPTRSWFLIEILSALFLAYYLLTLSVRQYQLINCHIAYPNLTFWHWIKKIVPKPLVITEHWSAYHFNFGVNKALPRIQRIFQQAIPVIAVSKSLVQDIKIFSNVDFPASVVSNIVNTDVFYYKETALTSMPSFFMLSKWKWPKDPLTLITAFARFTKNTPAHLRIGGYGPQLDEMKNLIRDLAIEDCVSFLGVLDAGQVAKELNHAKAFLHCSEYETFSVVCAEALCCGCPVLASGVGGISEFVDETNGILLHSNTIDNWTEALHNIMEKQLSRIKISDQSRVKFNRNTIGQKYFEETENYCESIL